CAKASHRVSPGRLNGRLNGHPSGPLVAWLPVKLTRTTRGRGGLCNRSLPLAPALFFAGDKAAGRGPGEMLGGDFHPLLADLLEDQAWSFEFRRRLLSVLKGRALGGALPRIV